MILATAAAYLVFVLALWLVAERCAERRALNLDFPSPACIVAAALCASIVDVQCSRSAAIAIAVLAVAAAIDARTGYIFDPIVLAGGAALVSSAAFAGAGASALLGGASTGAALYVLRHMTARRGLGAADVKLGSLVGAALGPHDGCIALCAGFMLGALQGLRLLLLRRASANTAVAFGPFLLAGSIAAVAYHRLNAGAP